MCACVCFMCATSSTIVDGLSALSTQECVCDGVCVYMGETICVCERKKESLCACVYACVCAFACVRKFVNVYIHIQTNISPRTRLTLCYALHIVSTLPIPHVV